MTIPCLLTMTIFPLCHMIAGNQIFSSVKTLLTTMRLNVCVFNEGVWHGDILARFQNLRHLVMALNKTTNMPSQDNIVCWNALVQRLGPFPFCPSPSSHFSRLSKWDQSAIHFSTLTN